MYDILIRGGTIIDGTGRPMYRADLAIQEDRIVEIGDLHYAKGILEIDATDHYVSPGFIDVNNHSDTYWQIFANPSQESLLYQGVTTVVGGNSGTSLAPLTSPDIIRSIQKWTDIQKINFNWLTMEEFLAEVKRKRLALNFATLVGHGTLRRGAMKDETRTITPEEIAIMDRLLKQGLHEGAIGFSTGLHYTHARDAGAREITSLVKTTAAEGGVYATYLRDEEAHLVKAVEEAIVTAREAGASLHISHLKAVGEKYWPLMEEAFNLIEAAALSDLDISFDVYPYTMTGSVMYTLFPEWITKDGRRLMLERLRDPQVRQAVLRDLHAKGLDYSEILISSSHLSKMLSRRKISEIASLQGKTPEETMLDFLLASDGQAIVSLEVLSEKNVLRAIQHPFSIISTNGAGYKESYRDTGNLVHPRNFGTFPKVLREYVRERKVLSWEEAIHKMSGKPAKKFHLEKRGVLQKGYAADVVVFDPKNITDHSTMENPYQYATGVKDLIINGQITLHHGQLGEAKSGKILYSKRKLFHW